MGSEFVRPRVSRVPQALRGDAVPAWPPVGCWVGASRALGREVPVTEARYPHVCRMPVQTHTTPWTTVELLRRDCAACAVDQTAAAVVGR